MIKYLSEVITLRFLKDFYDTDALTLSKKLLGKVLVRNDSGVITKGIICETEAYIGAIDKASHAYGNRRTERTEPLYGPSGIIYVYFIYGMYNCFNIISGKENEAEGVLIRAVTPLEGQDVMCRRRYKKNLHEITKTQLKNLCNGPGKLCIAMNITRENNKEDLITSPNIYLENGEDIPEDKIVKSKRIGIDYAEEAADFLWRFTY